MNNIQYENLEFENRFPDLHVYKRILPENSTYRPGNTLQVLTSAAGANPTFAYGYLSHIGTINATNRTSEKNPRGKDIEIALHENLPGLLGFETFVKAFFARLRLGARRGDNISVRVQNIRDDSETYQVNFEA